MREDGIELKPSGLTRRRFLALAGSSGAALLLASCAAPAAPAPTAKPAAAPPPASSAGGATAATWGPAEKKKVVWSTWSPGISNVASMYVAMDKGYYKEEGIDEVQVVDTEQGLEGVVGGSVDFARQDTGPAIAAWQKGVKIKCLCPWRTAENFLFVVRDNIKTLQDMDGKKFLNYPEGDRLFIMYTDLMKEAGYDTSKVKINWIQMPGGSDPKALAFIDGKADGTYTQQDLVEKVTAANGRLLYNKLLKWPQESMVASEDFIAKNPNLVRRFMRATIRGSKIWTDITQKDYVLQMMTSKYGFTYDAEYSKGYQGEIAQFEGDMGFEPAEWQKLIDNYMIGQTGPKPTPTQFYDVKPLNEAQVSLGLKARPTW